MKRKGVVTHLNGLGQSFVVIDGIAVRLDGDLLLNPRFHHAVAFRFVLKVKIVLKQDLAEGRFLTYGNGFHRSRLAGDRLGGHDFAFGRDATLAVVQQNPMVFHVRSGRDLRGARNVVHTLFGTKAKVSSTKIFSGQIASTLNKIWLTVYSMLI